MKKNFWKFQSIYCYLLCLGVLSLPLARAGESLKGSEHIERGRCGLSSDPLDWSIEVGSGVHFSNVRNSHLDSYTIVPIHLTAALAVDEVSLDHMWGGIFRGYTEFLFRGYGMILDGGQESRMIGASFGPRYNFVQPGWKLIPFIEATVGFGFADSNPQGSGKEQIGIGQDFNFMFSVASGVRYDFSETVFARLSAVYTHFSNAGLSEPAHANRAIDAVGPELSVGFRF